MNSTQSFKKGSVTIILLAIVSIFVLMKIFGYIGAALDQSKLEKDNSQISISEISDHIDIEHPTTEYKLTATISNISALAKVTINNQTIDITNKHQHTGQIQYITKDLHEGDNNFKIDITDGKRQASKTVTINRQTKAVYDQKMLEKAIASADDSIKKAETDPSEQNIANAESAIQAIPNNQQAVYSKRLTVIKNTKRYASASSNVLATGLYRVLGVIDGDTINISYNNKTEKVRMIGLDTPETKDPRKPVQCFGREASQRMSDLVNGKNVRIEQDSSQGTIDKYGRLLLYIYLEDGTNVAYKMIADGYGHEYTYKIPYKYQSQFKVAQKEAESNKRGLWADSTCNGNTNKPAIQQSTRTSQAAPSPSQVPSLQCPNNCTQARAMGMTNMNTSHPCYRPKLDRDRDGIACER